MGKNVKTTADVLVIGGGASGMAAAITAALRGKRVILLEGGKEPGKKILATGNGKCNLTHKDVSVSAYHTDDPETLSAFLTAYPTEKVLTFFHDLGLETHERNGYYYPLCDQAAMVVKLLRTRMEELGITVIADKVCEGVASVQGKFMAHTFDADYYGKGLILCCGSRAGGYWKHRIDGYTLAASFSHHTAPLYPSLMKLQLETDEEWKAMKGLRAQGGIFVPGDELQDFDAGTEGKETETPRDGLYASGELQFTQEGISGIPVFQVSGAVAQALSKGENACVTGYLDLLPEVPPEGVEAYCRDRIQGFKTQKMDLEKMTPERFTLGLFTKKILYVVCRQEKMDPGKVFGPEFEKRALALLQGAKNLGIRIRDHAPLSEAQVCRGGVYLSEVTSLMESKKTKGLYLCGEMLNVDGICGGYNLHFAFASGIAAGEHVL